MRLKKDFPLADGVPEHSATIIDGMSLVQRVKVTTSQPTLSDFSSSIFAIALKREPAAEESIYREMSIKYTERAKKNEESGLQPKDITAKQMIK